MSPAFYRRNHSAFFRAKFCLKKIKLDKVLLRHSASTSVVSSYSPSYYLISFFVFRLNKISPLKGKSAAHYSPSLARGRPNHWARTAKMLLWELKCPIQLHAGLYWRKKKLDIKGSARHSSCSKSFCKLSAFDWTERPNVKCWPTWLVWTSRAALFQTRPALLCRAGFISPGRLLPDRLDQTGPVVKSRGFKAHPAFGRLSLHFARLWPEAGPYFHVPQAYCMGYKTRKE